MYGKLAVICALRRQKGVWIVLYVFIAMPIVLTYLGNASLPTGQLITSVRID